METIKREELAAYLAALHKKAAKAVIAAAKSWGQPLTSEQQNYMEGVAAGMAVILQAEAKRLRIELPIITMDEITNEDNEDND